MNSMEGEWLRRYSINVRAAGIWAQIVSENGYYVAQFGESSEYWPEMHAWCKGQFGEEHYSWAGSDFFFETEQDRNFFHLRWGRH